MKKTHSLLKLCLDKRFIIMNGNFGVGKSSLWQIVINVLGKLGRPHLSLPINTKLLTGDHRGLFDRRWFDEIIKHFLIKSKFLFLNFPFFRFLLLVMNISLESNFPLITFPEFYISCHVSFLIFVILRMINWMSFRNFIALIIFNPGQISDSLEEKIRFDKSLSFICIPKKTFEINLFRRNLRR
jgi:hypothetical protein